MRAVDLIVKKRSGGELSRAEIEWLVGSYVRGEVPDYQISSFLMAVFFRGMTSAETAALTETMLRSGDVIDLAGTGGPFVDKHSTGGVGDKTSLIIAPIVACRGVFVPMMSGRALGHTGGTLDKLDSIPGYKSRLDNAEFRSVLARCGFAMTGQTDKVVPADRLLYGLRDVTGTVESVPLITASILSKKKAEGTEALVLDVKCGKGAFMKDLEKAEELARSLVATGTELGMKVTALITAMDEPLGNMVGNFLEVEESVRCLEGEGPADLMELCYELASLMLVLGGKAATPSEGRRMAAEVIASGEARGRFMKNVVAQGGDEKKLEAMLGTYRAPLSAVIRAERAGRLLSIDSYAAGLASCALGAGRNKTDDPVHPDVGIEFLAKSGKEVARGEPLCRIYGRDEGALAEAERLLAPAFAVGEGEAAPRKIVIKEISRA